MSETAKPFYVIERDDWSFRPAYLVVRREPSGFVRDRWTANIDEATKWPAREGAEAHWRQEQCSDDELSIREHIDVSTPMTEQTRSEELVAEALDWMLCGAPVCSKGTYVAGVVSRADVQRLAAELTRLAGERDELAAFKSYVHQRLDEADVPTHPDGEHSKAGCRVGDRLDIALEPFETCADYAAEIHALRAREARARSVVEPFAKWADWHNGMVYDDDHQVHGRGSMTPGVEPEYITLGHLRAARAFLADEPASPSSSGDFAAGVEAAAKVADDAEMQGDPKHWDGWESGFAQAQGEIAAAIRALSTTKKED